MSQKQETVISTLYRYDYRKRDFVLMDRRILKTKKCLKDALRMLMADKPFEKITVTEICEEANTGRLTFYKYYKDKADLLGDCFRDMQDETERRYKALQKNNTGNSFRQSFVNLIDAIMDVAGQYSGMISKLLTPSGILTMYYQFIMDNLEKFEISSSQMVRTKYDIKQLNSFMTMGLWGFVYAKGPDFDERETRKKARLLIGDLLRSDIFQTNASPDAGSSY